MALNDLKKALEQKAMTVTDIRNYYEDVMERFNDDDMDMETKERLIHTHYVSIDVLKDLFSVFLKDHEQENAVRIEQIKDEKNTKIDALQLAILTIYKPEIEKLKRKLDETHSLVKDNVHVPHKQLSELLAKAPNYEQLDSVGGMESYAVQMWGSDVEKWIAELKELLEART